MTNENIFSPNYLQARQNFLKAAQDIPADLKTYPLSVLGVQGEELAIDVATVGEKSPDRIILVTSGIHGVEGYLGSAVQTAWLRTLRDNPSSFDTTAVVLIHALNPYGFSWVRRVNENNVDLNRNFLLDSEPFSGAPFHLKKITWLQKPVSPDNKFFNLELYTGWARLIHGFQALRSCLLHGQFDYPQGLFWGGHEYEETSRILRNNIDSWTKNVPQILHLDIHTGLGQYGHCHLLLFGPDEADPTRWLKSKFPVDTTSLGTALANTDKPKGIMGDWLSHHFETQRKFYAYMALEFGTYPIFQVFKALYQENRFYRHSSPQHPAAKNKLLEVFYPADPAWRDKCLTEGLAMIEKSRRVIRDLP